MKFYKKYQLFNFKFLFFKSVNFLMNFLDELCSFTFVFIHCKGREEHLDTNEKQELKNLLIEEDIYEEFDTLNNLLN